MMRRKCKVKTVEQDFPGSPVVKNPAVNIGDAGLIPGSGRSHMWLSNKVPVPQLLSPRVHLLKCALKPVRCNRRSHQNEKPQQRNQRVAPAHHN